MNNSFHTAAKHAAATPHCSLILQISCVQARATPSFSKAMAEKRYTVSEVIDGLEGSDFNKMILKGIWI